MPRGRAIPVRQPQGNPNIPDTGSVIVRLGDEPAPQLVYGSSTPAAIAAAKAPAADRGGPIPTEVLPEVDPVTQRSDAVQPQRRTAAPPRQVEYADEGEDDALAQLRASEKRAKERAKAAETAHAQTLQWATTQANEAAAARHEMATSNRDTVQSALQAAEQELKGLNSQWADAMGRADYAAAGAIQDQKADAQYRIAKLRDGLDELEAEVKKPVRAAAPPTTNANIEAVLARMPNLMDSEKDWIREHPDSMESPENQQRLQVAFRDATARGLQRGSPEYFDFFNDRLGYDQEPPAGDDDEYEEEPPRQQRRNYQMPSSRNAAPQRRVSAPVRGTRTPGGQPVLREGEIMLTEEQRRAAKIAGVDEVTYARGLQRLLDYKRQGMYGMSEQK